MKNLHTDHTHVIVLDPREWTHLLFCLGTALGAARKGLCILTVDQVLVLTNKINEGNPHFRPCVIPEEQPKP